ncbi:MAG: RtcB family protein, partial [Clostridiales bacterium]|nr:RtcB family protein [Clostridiales bacterium]
MNKLPYNIEKISDYKYLIPKTADMKVPGLIFADDAIMKKVIEDGAYKQVINVAGLRGIRDYSMAMPDIHYGYGFPIGGVAAFDADEGIISPGGIGYDIKCGVRLIRTNVDADDLDRRAITQILKKFYDKIPPGVGRSGGISLSVKELKKLLTTGANWAIKRGYGSHEHLVNIEEGGVAEGADPN